MPRANEGSVQLTADSTIRHSNLQAVNPNSLAAFIITASRGGKTVLLLKTGQFAHELLFSRPFHDVTRSQSTAKTIAAISSSPYKMGPAVTFLGLQQRCQLGHSAQARIALFSNQLSKKSEA